jgi:GNAT superfamily N-acetyltransferase
MTDLIIRPITAADYQEWDPLYHGYADFYKVASSVEKRRITFDWILDPANVVEGLVIEQQGRLIGLAHYREMPRPLHGMMMGFLDDLFITPDARGTGASKAIFNHLQQICRDRGWTAMRWLTQDHNYRARALYDQIGAKSLMNLYEMTVD